MRIGHLIEVLTDIKKHYGDKYIWSLDELSFPCPRKMEVELCSKIKRTDCGYSGGKADSSIKIEVAFEYEGGVDVLDRSFDQVDW